MSVAVSSLCRELKLDDSEGVVEGKNKGKASGGGVNNAFPKHLIETEGDENEEPRKFGAMGATELQGVAELELQDCGYSSVTKFKHWNFYAWNARKKTLPVKSSDYDGGDDALTPILDACCAPS